MALEWYVVRVATNREDSVRDKLVRRIKGDGLEHRIPQILVPVERFSEVKNGKKKVVSRKIYPGYLMIQAALGEQASEAQEDQAVWFALHETQGFGDFVGGGEEPTPMTPDEVEGILSRMHESEDTPRMAVRIKRGDRVRITEGPFEGFDGSVEEVDETKGILHISVTIFGRATAVEIDHWQVEAV
ncbi:MAG: transcription termination/antitermination factor NusG [Planctomycetes bacterium]|nr:transcription termination/antitermination factor NusG [Planctomycetota bacterium]NQU49567.1 transcription termination/antitermination factor NusG [Planctomycetota bacterium]